MRTTSIYSFNSYIYDITGWLAAEMPLDRASTILVVKYKGILHNKHIGGIVSSD